MDFLNPEQSLKSKLFWEKYMGQAIPMVTRTICECIEDNKDREPEEISFHIQALSVAYPNASSEDIAYFMTFTLFTYARIKDFDLKIALNWVLKAQKLVNQNVH